MPELPEVETVARLLREREPVLIGRTIESVDVRWPRTPATPGAADFAAQLAGLRVVSVGRHGKVIVIGLRAPDARARHLLVHLRMSGRLDVVPAPDAATPHARVIAWLDGGAALRFDDARKFGRMWLVDDPATVLGALGPDALTVSGPEFAARLLERRGALKPVLLDQSFVAGVGNIYADESLHRARLHPLRAAASLGQAGADRLHGAVRAVLEAGVRANGASFDWVYPDGNFQQEFGVYGRTGKPCPNCGTPIRRILVGQRATHFCPHCQRAPRRQAR